MRRVAFLATVTIIGMTLAAAPNEAQQARYHIRPIELTGNLHVLTSDPAEEGRRTGGNTHTHYDHSGSNPEFPDTVNFVAHENTAAHLASTDCDDGMGYEGGSIKNCERFQGENRKFLPDTTFSTRHTLFSGADQIDLYYFGRGHTDGDTFVVFKDARTVHTGDLFARKRLPFVDADNANGSATEFGADAAEGRSTASPPVVGRRSTQLLGHADEPHVWQDLSNSPASTTTC